MEIEAADKEEKFLLKNICKNSLKIQIKSLSACKIKTQFLLKCVQEVLKAIMTKIKWSIILYQDI